MNATAETPPNLLPPPLCKGDTIGLVAPGGAWNEKDCAKGIQLLADFGFQVKILRDLDTKEHYLAGSDHHRHTVFNQVWRDPEVKAIMAVRGGYGSLRILADIDYDLIRANPKIFVGFSDITSLHQAIAKKTGLITFHGPMVTTLPKSDKESVQSFFTTLTRGFPEPIASRSVEIIKPGHGRGPLIGGNLTTAVHLIATPFETSWRDRIVFLEDIGEAPYRIDRMLTHLKMAGRFAGINGLLLGSFTDCGDEEMIWTRVRELFSDESFPIWANFPIGHGAGNRIVPLGIETVMDPSSAVLTFTGPCCRAA